MRKRFGLAAAAVLAVAVGSIGLALAGSGHHARTAKLTIQPAAPAGSTSGVARTHASPASRVQVTHGTLTPAVRDMRPAPGKWNLLFKKVGEHSRAESLNVPDTHQGSALVQSTAPKGQMPSPIVNFPGVTNVNGVFPPDTEGDIGPNHYMQWVNLSFQIYNRNGSPATGVMPGYSLFTGQPVCGSPVGNGGDPIVLYDQFANRWIAAQLAYPTYPSGPFYQCVAVSQTSDPTGSWCAYQYVAHATNLNDYPKFGIWPTQHAYMITTNQFAEPAETWAGVGVYALERDAMLSGCGTARMLYKDMFAVDPNLWGGMLPADVDGSTLPPADAPAPLIEVDDDAWGFPQDRLDVWNATVDWTGSGAISVTHQGTLPTATFDSYLCPNHFGPCIPQPGTTARLDTLNDRLMYRMAYRNFGDHRRWSSTTPWTLTVRITQAFAGTS